MIESVNLQDRTFVVNFDNRMITYDATELDELVHAYATTIHKVQGSEYPIVIMPILMNHFVMLQRNLIYTGITRAKKILVRVGTNSKISSINLGKIESFFAICSKIMGFQLLFGTNTPFSLQSVPK